MSNINYSLNNKGVRLIPAEKAWIKTKNGRLRLNPKYKIIGKMDVSMPNMIVTASDKKKPSYKGNTYDLNSTAKKQIVEHFYNDKGKRNKKTVAYFGIEKKQSD
jgi:hypothetical protein